MPKKSKAGGNSSKRSRNSRTEAAKAAISRQPQRTLANKVRRRLKHLKRHPSDLQTSKLL